MVTYIDRLYWQHIKAGTRTFASLTAARKETVKSLADEELKDGVILQKDYNKYLGIED